MKNNIKKIIKDIPKNIDILAASKTRTTDEILEAKKTGISIFGENYLQEAEKKYIILDNKIKLHMIGHLQTNKVKKAVQIFDMIQTVDSIKLAKEIDKRCKEINKTMPILIEINSAEEENKTGCKPKDILILAQKIEKMKNIRLKGLMTMGPLNDENTIRTYFRKTKKIFDNLKNKFSDIDTLSMGMSDSYKIAIEEGSTMIRLGTILFGKRNYKL